MEGPVRPRPVAGTSLGVNAATFGSGGSSSRRNDQQRLFSTLYSPHGQSPVEGRQPTAIPHGKGQQIGVGYLSRGRDLAVINPGAVEQAEIFAPETVIGLATEPSKHLGKLRDRQRVRRVIFGPCDAQKAILSDGAGSPTLFAPLPEPVVRRFMRDVPDVQQRNQHVDVEQVDQGSSSRSLLTSSRVIGGPPR